MKNDERLYLVKLFSRQLSSAGSDAGRIMFDAYRQVSSETDPKVRATMLDFLECVRISYLHPTADHPSESASRYSPTARD